ncbi:hypothetical protein KAFR_0H03790 [Kazachstania africana CBS 2517]|uniref:Sir1 ORC-binding domain-containing protein n=1 Tax=Kazachstania africana (strain ATCC 22294 / BCRC 22015 / CBS 2517 / CECT 1963 / NBRC 1671 / NRRL Y-8276) TaxID=1071382 RepID=H2AYL2_KAZAF|nr:hypothetical protein KAFR_0H03790 [Kazachstania africana CBS 2517]CCF59789.1 hypothetical protein KAFR_0H03790 [Kazachstania africana CBS 2517]
MKAIISERYCVIEGWIVDQVDRIIVPKSKIVKNLVPKKLELLNRQFLIDFKNVDLSQSVIYEYTSQELHDLIDKEFYEFSELLDGRIINKDGRIYQRSKTKIKRTFTKRCHRVSIHGRQYVYLLKSQANLAHIPNMAEVLTNADNAKDNHVLSMLVRTAASNFTPEQYKLIQDFNSEIMVPFCVELLKKEYNRAIESDEPFLDTDMDVSTKAFIENIDNTTFDEYGNYLAPALYFFLNRGNPSIFLSDDFVSPKKRKYDEP